MSNLYYLDYGDAHLAREMPHRYVVCSSYSFMQLAMADYAIELTPEGQARWIKNRSRAITQSGLTRDERNHLFWQALQSEWK